MTELTSGPTAWRTAQVVTVEHPHAAAVVLRLAVPDRPRHAPGQHYVVRLTAEDGYRAQRSYSVASAPDDELVELFVDRLPDGEVSGFLADEVRPGDALEVRGPIGGFFVWDGATPALCVGGGSGVVPFVSMVRHATTTARADLLDVVAAARELDALPYAAQLKAFGARIALSRSDFGARTAGRLGAADLDGLVDPGRTVFVCGSTPFAEAASRLLVDLGQPAGTIKVERFGPTG